MTYLITILQRHRDIWSILWHLRYQWFSISLKGRWFWHHSKVRIWLPIGPR